MGKIPHIIHYCWFGRKPLPELAERCIASWKEHMPEWEYMKWTEDNFDIAAAPLYVRQAYEAKKYAFVSDYVRLWALERYGGLYMDVDFEVYRPFDDLMDRYVAFAGYEGSKRSPVMQGVIASEPHGAWVRDMLYTYEVRRFILPDGRFDMTPNTSYFTDRLEAQGFVADGKEKDFYFNKNQNQNDTAYAAINNENILEVTENAGSTVADSNLHNLDPQLAREQVPGQTTVQSCDADTAELSLHNPLQKNVDCINQEKAEKNNHADEGIFMLHVFPVECFCPVLTTGENVRTAETYCEYKGESSWAKQGWKGKILSYFSPAVRTRLIKLKRRIFG